MNFTKINLAGKSEFFQTRKLKDLHMNTKYKVLLLKIVETRFGRRVVVHLNQIPEDKNTFSQLLFEDDQEEVFLSFLPTKMSDILLKNKEEPLKQLQQIAEEGGLSMKCKKNAGGFVNVEFDPI